MTVLAFAPIHDSGPGSKHPHDATGAFQPEAAAWCRLHGGQGHLVDNHATKPSMLGDVLHVLRDAHDLTAVAFVCHGLRMSLQLGLAEPSIDRVADALRGALVPTGRVVLYACDTGRDADGLTEDDLQPGPGGEGGYADRLADALSARGWSGWLDAHACAGHCSRNRYVRRFRGDQTGGTWIVEPGSRLWASWSHAMRDRESTLRLRFPLMTIDEVRAELGG